MSARSMVFGLALAVALPAALPARAFANSTGITGRSGKQGTICTNPGCHAGGTAPLVHFEGPMELAAGAIATFRFVIQSQSPSQTFGGFNVAASAGTLGVVSGQGEQPLGGELTHVAPKPNDASGMASFQFTWQAPGISGTQTLFGAGNSVNRNGQNTGDLAAATTLMVMVVGQQVSPTPTPSGVVATPTATATPGAIACVGDCSGDGEVTIDELISGVSIALGTASLSVCPVFDANGDGEVTIDELLTAVRAALNGCPR